METAFLFEFMDRATMGPCYGSFLCGGKDVALDLLYF